MKDNRKLRDKIVQTIQLLFSVDLYRDILDANKRQNILKAGHVVLHGLSDGKWPKTPPPLSVEPPKKPDRWKGVRRVGSFAGGSTPNTPQLVSYLPSASTPAKPSNTPEELLKQYVEAVSHKDIQRALGLFTPEARKSVEYTMSDTSEGFEKGIMPKLRIDHIENSTSAKAFVTLIANEKEIDSGIIYLRQIDNAWYLDRFSM